MILATLCYVQTGGKTLMMHRNKRPDDVHLGKYNGLGGKFEPGESPEECVVREVFEESNLRIKPRLRGVMTFPQFAKGHDWYCFLYTASEFEGDLKDDCPEGRPGVDRERTRATTTVVARRPHFFGMAKPTEILLSKIQLCRGRARFTFRTVLWLNKKS
jgi:ADP-ribose pyrophosphatase YjhB (NUDIX family)